MKGVILLTIHTSLCLSSEGSTEHLRSHLLLVKLIQTQLILMNTVWLLDLLQCCLYLRMQLIELWTLSRWHHWTQQVRGLWGLLLRFLFFQLSLNHSLQWDRLLHAISAKKMSSKKALTSTLLMKQLTQQKAMTSTLLMKQLMKPQTILKWPHTVLKW